MSEEEWKKCFENYEISSFGNCRRKLKNGIYVKINGSISNKGYRYFQVQRDGKRINNNFHVMVALVFLGPRNDNMVIDHIDRNKLNNNKDNLRYCSQKENTINCCKYRSDIEIIDIKERQKILMKEWRENNKDEISIKKK